MDFSSFQQYLKNQDHIAPATKDAYTQDLADFFLFISKKNILMTDIQQSDIHEYINYMASRTLSHAYGMRKLAALKCALKWIREHSARDMSELFPAIAISRFPVFCTNTHIEQLFATYTHASTYRDLRDKLLLTVLARYGLTIQQAIQVTTDGVYLRCNQTVIIELSQESRQLISAYLQESRKQTLSFSEQTPLFAIPIQTRMQAISRQAIWSILKKMCAPLRTSPIQHTLDTEISESHPQHVIYRQKHPRS